MTRTEHLLANLAEEAAELNKECMKALRFGLAGYPNYSGKPPRQTIMIEYAHVVGVMQQLLSDGVLTPQLDFHADSEKKRLRMLDFIKEAGK